MSYVNCNLCPRQCGVDRTTGQTGYCGCPDVAMVAKTMLHKWEEPVLAGNGGSGAIFLVVAHWAAAIAKTARSAVGLWEKLWTQSSFAESWKS